MAKGKRSIGEVEIDRTTTKKLKSKKDKQRSTHLGDVPDSEEDAGHSATLQFLAAAKETTRRSNAIVATHAHVVNKEMQSLEKELNDRALNILLRNAQLQASFVNILAHSRWATLEKDDEGSEKQVNEAPAGHTIYQNGMSAIASSRELMAQYDGICEHVALEEGAAKTNAGRNDGCEALQRLIRTHAKKVKLELYHFLHTDSKEVIEPSIEPPPDESLTADTDLWTRYAVTAKQEEGKAIAVKEQGWGVVAKHAQRAVHRMVRDLPDESD